MKRKTITRPFEIKGIKADGTFTGYASVYGNVDSHRDIVIKGAFNNSLQKRYRDKGRKGVPMLDQHDGRLPLGLFPIDSIKEDDNGLFVEGEFNMKVQRALEAHALAEQGALTGLSIGFNTVEDDWHESGVRIIKEVDLWEISLVTFPSNDLSRVESVKEIETLATLSDCERALRDAGYDRKEALAFIARVKQLAGSAQSDSDDDRSLKLKTALDLLREIKI